MPVRSIFERPSISLQDAFMRPFRVRTFFHALAPLTLALGLGLAACDDDLVGPVYPEDVEFDASLGVDLDQMTRLQSGVYVQTLEEGEGPGVTDGNEVNLDYTLWLPDGTEIESREESDFTITTEPGGVIEGFYLGVLGAREGETRLMVIPSELAWGEAGSEVIPGGSVVVFRVRVNTISQPE
jgi:hypothetical protein